MQPPPLVIESGTQGKQKCMWVRQGKIQAASVKKRKEVYDMQGQLVRQDEVLDYSSQEVKILLAKYLPQLWGWLHLWLVQLMEQGAESVCVDNEDAPKCLGLTNYIYIQAALGRVGTNTHTLILVLCEGIGDRHTNKGICSDGPSHWVTLHQA